MLNALAESEDISEEAAHAAKQRYEELHGAVLAAMAAEKARLDEARTLKARRDAEVARTEQPPPPLVAPSISGGEAAESLGAVEVLREDEEAARAEVALAEEREQMQQLELVSLQRQRNEAMAAVQAIQDEHRQRLLPKIEQLRKVCTHALCMQACVPFVFVWERQQRPQDSSLFQSATVRDGLKQCTMQRMMSFSGHW